MGYPSSTIIIDTTDTRSTSDSNLQLQSGQNYAEYSELELLQQLEQLYSTGDISSLLKWSFIEANFKNVLVQQRQDMFTTHTLEFNFRKGSAFAPIQEELNDIRKVGHASSSTSYNNFLLRRISNQPSLHKFLSLTLAPGSESANASLEACRFQLTIFSGMYFECLSSVLRTNLTTQNF